MSFSINGFVKQKMLAHGVRNTSDGMLTITGSRLFLDFVRLERAVRLQDFAAVQSSVGAIERRTLSMGKRHLALFAYMYLYFSDATPKYTHSDAALEGGGVRRTVDCGTKYHPPSGSFLIGREHGTSAIPRASFGRFMRATGYEGLAEATASPAVLS